jgi:hypothetical protein
MLKDMGVALSGRRSLLFCFQTVLEDQSWLTDKTSELPAKKGG